MKNIIKRSPLDVIRDVRSELGLTVLNARTGNLSLKRGDKIAIIMSAFFAVFMALPMTAMAAGESDIITTATNFAGTYFTKIVTFSTVAAVFLTACCMLWLMLSPTSKGAQGPMDWIKRIWICWIIINGMTAFVTVMKSFVTTNTDINAVAGGTGGTGGN